MTLSSNQFDLIRLGFHFGMCRAVAKKSGWESVTQNECLGLVIRSLRHRIDSDLYQPGLARLLEEDVGRLHELFMDWPAQLRHKGHRGFLDTILLAVHECRERVVSLLDQAQNDCFQIGELLADSQREPKSIVQAETESDSDFRRRQLLETTAFDAEVRRIQPWVFNQSTTLGKLLRKHKLKRTSFLTTARSGPARDVEKYPYPVDRWAEIEESLGRLCGESPYLGVVVDEHVVRRAGRRWIGKVIDEFDERHRKLFKIYLAARERFTTKTNLISIWNEIGQDDAGDRDNTLHAANTTLRKHLNTLGLKLETAKNPTRWRLIQQPEPEAGASSNGVHAEEDGSSVPGSGGLGGDNQSKLGRTSEDPT